MIGDFEDGLGGPELNNDGEIIEDCRLGPANTAEDERGLESGSSKEPRRDLTEHCAGPGSGDGEGERPETLEGGSGDNCDAG